MRARPRRLLLVTACILLFGAGCGGETDESLPTPLPSHAEGLITEVRPEDGEPQSFLLATEQEGTFEILLADEVDYGMDLEHLREHMDEELPVRVQLEERDGRAVALLIEDV